MRSGFIAGLLVLSLFLPTVAASQQRLGPEAPPDSVAAGFQAALRAGAMDVVAELLHPQGLRGFQRLLEILTESDESGGVRALLLGDPDTPSLSHLSPVQLFIRSTRALLKEMPGVTHSLSVREVTVLGSVREPPDLAHVVYRNKDLLPGAVPQLRVMTLRRTGTSWRVVESDELDLIREAMSGLARTHRPAPGGPGERR